MIHKFDEFLFEAKSREDNTSLLLKLFNEKPVIKLQSVSQEGAYSLAGMKRYFRDNGKTNDQCDDAFYVLNKDKSNKIESISIRDHKYNENIPHFYIGLTKEEALKIKEDYEKDNLNKNKDLLDKRKEAKKTASRERDAKKNKPRTKKSDSDPTKTTKRKTKK